MKFHYRVVAVVASAFALIVPPALAAAGETKVWNYTIQGTSPASGTQRPTSGVNRAELFEEKGAYTFRIRGNTAPLCYSIEVPAAVEESAKTITITPTPRFENCERIRLVINKDGTGGVQQFLLGKRGNQAWATDEDRDYGLTPRS